MQQFRLLFSKKLFDFLHNRTVKSVNRLRHQNSAVVENNVRFLLFCLFTDKLYKSLLLHILFVNDFPCICLAFYLIATLIQNQVATLSFWCQKAVELYQCFFVHIVKCGLSCRCDCNNVTDTKFSDFEFVGMNKLERIEKDIEKTKGKIAELQKQLRELEAAKTEQENLQIVQLVRGLNMTPQEFAAFVRGGALQAAPAPIPDFEQEDNAHEEI